jgi:Pyruvate/2-oxoacid:ferredoxin oxidoreductase gamma subunit
LIDKINNENDEKIKNMAGIIHPKEEIGTTKVVEILKTYVTNDRFEHFKKRVKNYYEKENDNEETAPNKIVAHQMKNLAANIGMIGTFLQYRGSRVTDIKFKNHVFVTNI